MQDNNIRAEQTYIEIMSFLFVFICDFKLM